MIEPTCEFLPGVPAHLVLQRLNAAGGHEVRSGKLSSPESSAALAVNTFGWFMEQPELLPAFPPLQPMDWPATLVEIEHCARFPWSGGRHPWLDAWIETDEAVIGVESKRFEPYRDRKEATFSNAFDRPVWHDQMAPYKALKDALRLQTARFQYLDGAQLVKHALGIATEARRKRKKPYLLYLFAEPRERSGKPISAEIKQEHRTEIARFADATKGAEVKFGAMSYREWLDSWPRADLKLVAHRQAVLDHFRP